LYIQVTRPDGKPETLGLLVLDEPTARQSDPTGEITRNTVTFFKFKKGLFFGNVSFKEGLILETLEKHP
jgi:hypothetical protein